MRSGTRMIVALLAVAWGTGTAWSQLYLVEPREGDYSETQGYDLSDDGSTLVGYSLGGTAPSWGFRYSLAHGRQDLTVPSHVPMVVSADGHRVGGAHLSFGPPPNEAHLFRESQSGGIEYLAETLPLIAAMDAAGNAMTGYEPIEGGRRRAVVWDEAGGYRPLQHFTQSVFSSEARDMSSDGRTIVGDFNLGLVQFPMVWREETGMTPLLLPTPGYEGYAGAVSPDGRMIAGRLSRGANDDRLAIWRDGQGPEFFDPLLSDESPSSINAAGMIVGGGIEFLGGAWVWSEELGKMPLRAYAEQFGVTFDTSFYLRTCEAISADGRVFAGEAVFPDFTQRGYLLVIPGPGIGLWVAALVGATARRRRVRQ